MPVKDWMSKDLVTVEEDTSIMKASRIMKQHNIQHLPVLRPGPPRGHRLRPGPERGHAFQGHYLGYPRNVLSAGQDHGQKPDA